MDTRRVIDIKKELRILKDEEETMKKNLIKMKGIESYYLNLINKNIILIPVPNTEKKEDINFKKKEDINFKKLLDNDDI
jgi:hypothetical protein